MSECETSPDAGSAAKSENEADEISVAVGTAAAAAETAGTVQSAESSPSSPVPGVKTKVDVLLKAAGDAPIMKKKKWSVDRTKSVGWIIEFIRKYLKLDTSESLFLYVNQAFAPAPDVEVGKLYDCFETDNKLIMHYCRSQAWG